MCRSWMTLSSLIVTPLGFIIWVSLDIRHSSLGIPLEILHKIVTVFAPFRVMVVA